MGGGATMRAVTKVAGIGVVNSGIRGRLSDNPVSAAATRAFACPVAAIGATSVTDYVKPVSEVINGTSVQKMIYGFDDWDLVDQCEDIAVFSGPDDNIASSVVFGGVPTLDEAKEATSELKDVLEKAYLSSPVSPRFENTDPGPSFSCLENPEAQQCDALLTTGSVRHAVQAFKFLNESPAAQAVVASIASDPNVWNSVLNNPDLQHFLHSQKTDSTVQHLNPGVEESSADKDGVEESSADKDDPGCQEFHLEDELKNYWKNIKVSVVDMMNNVSGYFQNVFGWGHPDEKASGHNMNVFEKALGPSLMGLAIMVIMVAVLKRPY